MIGHPAVLTLTIRAKLGGIKLCARKSYGYDIVYEIVYHQEMLVLGN